VAATLGMYAMQKLFLKHGSHSRDYRKCSGQELDLLMAVLKVSKAVKCRIGTISVVWSLKWTADQLCQQAVPEMMT